MEVYVDDMLVKSRKANNHVSHLDEMFQVLRQYGMKLNPLKCSFGVSSGKFLGFIVHARGIEANPEQVRALQDIMTPSTRKEMQSLKGKVAALSRFISKATDKCIPFFEALKKDKGKFEWTDECSTAFLNLIGHLQRPPVLSTPNEGEELYLYLAVSSHALSAALVREDNCAQRPVYFVSKRFTGAEARYPKLEKLAYCLLITSRKLRHYFQSHSIRVLTDQPLRQVLHRPDTSGGLLKWCIELSQYDITYHPHTAIKGQAIADFIAEFTTSEGKDQSEIAEDIKWNLFVDGASNEQRSGAGVVIITSRGKKLHYALRLEFAATNNDAEYEAVIAGLELALEIGVSSLCLHSDSQLIVNQILGEFQTRGERLTAYLKKTKRLLNQLDHY